MSNDRIPLGAPSAFRRTQGRRATARWLPEIIAYREELRRAVMAIEERRQRARPH